MYLLLLECGVNCRHLGAGELQHGADGVKHVTLALRIPGDNKTNNDILQVLQIGAFSSLAALQSNMEKKEDYCM